MKDPFVEEAHKHRMEHTRQFDSNLHRICEDLRESETSLGDRVVTLEPKKKRPKIASQGNKDMDDRDGLLIGHCEERPQ